MQKTILIVDDSVSLRHVATMALEHGNYKMIQAVDGVAALKILNGEKIHLIVSDINMPNMDGIEFITEVKKLEHYKYTPIIMLTTEIDSVKKQAAKDAGVKAWLHKPFQVSTLLAAIAKFAIN